MTFQGSLEVHKGHWGAFTDIVYLDVGDSQSQTHGITIGGVTLPGTVESAVDFDLKSTIWTLAGSYRSIASPSATVDWLAGARLANIEQIPRMGIHRRLRSGCTTAAHRQWQRLG